MDVINDTSSQTVITTLPTITGTYNSIISQTDLNTALALKQNILTASTNLVGIGSSITQLNWNNITLNRPTTFAPIMTNIYSKTETNTLTNAKQNTLSFQSPLVNNANTISLSTASVITTSGGQTINNGLTVNNNFISYGDIYEGNNYLYNKYETKLSSTSVLLGDGSSITNIEYSNIVNVPPPPSSSSSLTFISPLSKNILDEVRIDLSSYLTQSTAFNIFPTFFYLASHYTKTETDS
jgi:hypothetical protein